MLVVVMANIDVQTVYVQHEGLESEGIPVGQVVAECTSCKKEREKSSKSPRQLETLPREVTQSKEFKNRGLPIRLCTFCDGEALPNALITHKKRINM